MTGPKSTSRSRISSGFVIGRERFGKISAVERIELTDAQKQRATKFDRSGLSAEAHRKAIIRTYRKG